MLHGRMLKKITCSEHSVRHATSITSSVEEPPQWQFRCPEFFGQRNGSCPCVAFLPPDKCGESSEIEQFDNYNLFVTTQFGKEGSRRIVCHSPGRRPQVQQSTFFLLLLLAAKRRHFLIIMRDTEPLENRNMVFKISGSFTHKVFRSIASLPLITHA